MKKAIQYLVGLTAAVLLLQACERLAYQEPEIRLNAVFAGEILFTDCLDDEPWKGYGTIEIEKKPFNYLSFHARNTEFCCSTDSILIGINQPEDTVDIEIYDMGPYAYCFCGHDLFFTIGPFKSKTYNFRLIESVDAYKRDTFLFSLDLSKSIDTVIFPLDTVTTIIPPDTTIIPPDTTIIPVDTTLNPPVFIETIYGGCNIDTSYRGQNEPDISHVEMRGDTAIIFAGFMYQCCAPFTTSFRMENGTIIIRLTDNCTQPYSACYCRCNCYYTFELKILLSKPFRVYPYKIFVADPKHGGDYLFWEGFLSGPI